MSATKRFCICYAELPQRAEQGDEVVNWHHAFLALMDTTDPENPVLLQQLHYNNSMEYDEIGHEFISGKVRPKVIFEFKDPETLSKVIFTPYFEGNAEHILPVWNHGLEFATRIKQTPHFFGHDFMDDPKVENCRTYTIRTLERMGFGFSREFAREEHGVSAARKYAAPLMANFNHAAPPDLPLALSMMANAELVNALPAEEKPADRPHDDLTVV